jgi:hypothetical protein
VGQVGRQKPQCTQSSSSSRSGGRRSSRPDDLYIPDANTDTGSTRARLLSCQRQGQNDDLGCSTGPTRAQQGERSRVQVGLDTEGTRVPIFSSSVAMPPRSCPRSALGQPSVHSPAGRHAHRAARRQARPAAACARDTQPVVPLSGGRRHGRGQLRRRAGAGDLDGAGAARHDEDEPPTAIRHDGRTPASALPISRQAHDVRSRPGPRPLWAGGRGRLGGQSCAVPSEKRARQLGNCWLILQITGLFLPPPPQA